MQMALFRVRYGFISAQVSGIFHEPLDTISAILCTFKRFHDFSAECEMGISHPLLLANLYMGTWRRGGGGIRRSHFLAMAHLKAELWLVRWYQNKHGGRNESNKAFENKCYLLYEINIFRINNSRVRKVIHGRLSAWPARSHRLVSWFPGSAKASPGNQETRRRDQLVPQTTDHGFP